MVSHRVRVTVRLYYAGTIWGISNECTTSYLHALKKKAIGGDYFGFSAVDYSGSFDSNHWVSLQFDMDVYRPEDRSAATYRRQIRAALLAVHGQVMQSWACIPPMFGHMNAFLDDRCIVSSLVHVREMMRQEWVQRLAERQVEQLRTMTTNVDEEWEREDREFDDESTAAERMRHGRIPGSGHLCVPGTGRSEPVAEREPARDGPECAAAASASISAEAAT